MAYLSLLKTSVRPSTIKHTICSGAGSKLKMVGGGGGVRLIKIRDKAQKKGRWLCLSIITLQKTTPMIFNNGSIVSLLKTRDI